MAIEGFSFQPGSPDQNRLSGQLPSAAITTPQSIVKLLSLRLPRQSVPGQIAPPALLQSAGGAGVGSTDLSSIIRALMQSFGLAPQAAGQAAAPQVSRNVPTPRIIPGTDQTDPIRANEPAPVTSNPGYAPFKPEPTTYDVSEVQGLF